MIADFKKVAIGGAASHHARVLPLIRPEAPADVDAITRLHTLAFGRDAEAQLVLALRAAGAIVLGMVAEVAGNVVGHVVLSEVTIEVPGARLPARALGLAPVAIVPAQQRRGLGGTLIAATLDRARQDGHRLCVVLGDPKYYGRFGFVPAHGLGLWCTFEAPRDAFQALELVKGSSPSGLVRYRPELETPALAPTR